MESTTVFCSVETAFRCLSCAAKIHAANKLASSHAHVWVCKCEVCKQIQVSFTCKEDIAALCVTWDRNIHSANPVARRHERLPVVPFYDSTVNVATKFHGSDFASPGNESTLFSIHLADGQITPNSIIEDPLDYKNSSSCTKNDMSISGISHASETTNRKKKGGGFLPGMHNDQKDGSCTSFLYGFAAHNLGTPLNLFSNPPPPGMHNDQKDGSCASFLYGFADPPYLEIG
nr:zinc finger protein CONSTANS-LIKE 4-like [Ipomoea batatas]